MKNIKDVAMQYKDADFKFYGRSKEEVDCFGLVVCVYNIVFNKSFEYLEYSRMPRNNQILKILGEISTPIDRININDFEFGDVIAFRFGKNKIPQHLGIYIGVGDFIHADKRCGKVIIESIDKYTNNIHSIHKMGE